MNGIHHVTAIAGPAQRNFDFYRNVLGMRLVKKTVNFEDPGTYHLYYGDGSGRPGTILTFFPWHHAAPGRAGIGETMETALRIPESSIGYWAHRFLEKGVTHEAIGRRFGQAMLPFRDPDGMRLALVGVGETGEEFVWPGGEIPPEHAIRGIHGVTLLLQQAEPTAAILTDVLGFTEEGQEGPLLRLRADGTDAGGIVDIRAAGDFLRGRQGAGSVHHVAFRAKDEDRQAEMMQRLAEQHGILVTGPLDRKYFRSIYFREPGGVLFEIATDIPGFTVDEPAAELGSSLMLPQQYEDRREAIEQALPEIVS